MNLALIVRDQNPWWEDAGARKARTRFPVRRDLHSRVLSQVQNLSDRRAAVVLGPRQVGKTVLLWQLADALLDAQWAPGNVTYFDFSDDRLVARSVTTRDVVEITPPGLDSKRPRVFLFDEISHAPGWDRWLKQHVDRGTDRIVATDSAATVLAQGRRESGLGRWDEIPMEALDFTEFLRLLTESAAPPRELFARRPNAIDEYLVLGGFPEYVRSADSPATARRRLREAIAERAIFRDLADLRGIEKVEALFVGLVQDSGSILKKSARQADLGVRSAHTMDRYVRRLLDSRLLIALPRRTLGRTGRVVRASSRVKARNTPKIFACDHGLISAFAPVPQPLSHEDFRGKIFETVVFRHLRHVASELGVEGLTYFREDRKADQHELDFVLELESGPVAVEVTSSDRPAKKLGRFLAAMERASLEKGLFVHGGMTNEEHQWGRSIPLHDFLMDPSAALEGVVR